MLERLRQLKKLRKYPSLILGLSILTVIVIVALYAMIAIPYSEAIRLWNPGVVDVWQDNPRNAQPIWWNWFTGDDLPRTQIITSEDDGVTNVEQLGDGIRRVEIVLPFYYGTDVLPKELQLRVPVTGLESGVQPPISVSWRGPDGVTMILREDLRRQDRPTYRISQDSDLRSRTGGLPHRTLFADPQDAQRALAGDYRMVVMAELPEGAEIDAKLLVYGQVHGWAGTDHLRRDLSVALLWGAPVALLFGVLAAVGAQVSTFVLGGIGTWFGGKVDNVFRRMTELTMILPLLPILIVVGHFYSRSLWVILGMVIVLNIFSAAYMVYRSMFMQAKSLPYFEAAQAYGAGNWRIIFRYLLPRMLPVLLPQFVLVIPSFVFLEASLAVIGLGDPVVPTWGKIIYDARMQEALFNRYYYWILQPSVLLMTMGFGFALVGFTLDRIFNPRLRTV